MCLQKLGRIPCPTLPDRVAVTGLCSVIINVGEIQQHFMGLSVLMLKGNVELTSVVQNQKGQR